MNKWTCAKYMKDLNGKRDSFPSFVWKDSKQVLQRLELEMELILFDGLDCEYSKVNMGDVTMITIEKQFTVDVYMNITGSKRGKR